MHLPWPFGIMRNVELGVVHEIPIVVSPSDNFAGPAETADQPSELVPAEAPAPPSADRLWDATHPSEASYLIASEERGQQSFQIANIDLRVVYRIGLSDTAAKDAAYSVASPEALIQAATGELLVRYFARYTLNDVLGQSREAFANEFRTALQTEMDRMSTGIEAIAVVVEAIHPPPGAASAYHNVQAAEILAKSRISFERADAVRKEKSAEQTALVERNQANAAAAELVDGAKSESVLFEADQQSYAQDGRVVLFERWLDRLSNSLGSSQFIVLDHRLTGATGPVLDLRVFGLGGAASGCGADNADEDTEK
jgi:regulator of protease activity HflC (stomatin/prohibitin superfamily)